MYRDKDELTILQYSLDEDERTKAEAEYEQSLEMASIELWERSLAQSPSEEEIATLTSILVLARPYQD